MMLRALIVAFVVLCPVSPDAWGQTTPKQRAQPPRPPAKKKPKKPLVPPVIVVPRTETANQTGPLYDEAGNAQREISEALLRAKKANRRVLIEWGANWSPACQRLRTMLDTDKNMQRILLLEYDVVHVNVGQVNVNIDIAASYGAHLGDPSSIPHLTVLDPDGQPLANANAARFEDKRGEYETKKVLEFLRGYQPVHPSAQTLLNQGFSAAKPKARQIMVVFGAPRSEASQRFDEWLTAPSVAPLLAQSAVIVRIDIDRTVGGSELLQRYTGSWRRHIPWLVFLDSGTGSVLASGGAKEDAVDFPSLDNDIPRLRDLLNAACKNLSAEDIDHVLAVLKPPQHSDGAAAASAMTTAQSKPKSNP